MATTGMIRWQVPPSEMAGKTADYSRRLLAAVHLIGEIFAARIEAYAKANAPWTDRTGAARANLRAVALKHALGFVLTLAHGVFYGVFLELKHAGKYAIINRAMEAHYAQIMSAMRALLRAS